MGLGQAEAAAADDRGIVFTPGGACFELSKIEFNERAEQYPHDQVEVFRGVETTIYATKTEHHPTDWASSSNGVTMVAPAKIKITHTRTGEMLFLANDSNEIFALFQSFQLDEGGLISDRVRISCSDGIGYEGRADVDAPQTD